MAKSMTGYGRSEVIDNERKFLVELKSVNNRYLDINIRMPRQFNPFEAKIRAELKKYMVRGKVDVFIGYEDLAEQGVAVRYNKKLAEEYMAHLNEIAADFGIVNNITASGLSGFPDVFTMEHVEEDEAMLWEPLSRALNEAAEQFAKARTAEGQFITDDLISKLDDMLESVDYIEKRAPQIITAYRERLREKVAEMLGDSHLDESRIMQEVVIYSDKICIDEELVRLHSHIRATKDALLSEDSVGRKLDFLAQEMNREANTILSKSDDVISADKAIELKTMIEKIREQIQNIE